MATQVILLEKIEKLGEMGETVSVKPGYARNFLLPQNKALRATDANIAYFESQKALAQNLTSGYGGGDFSWTAACALDLFLENGSV